VILTQERYTLEVQWLFNLNNSLKGVKQNVLRKMFLRFTNPFSLPLAACKKFSFSEHMTSTSFSSSCLPILQVKHLLGAFYATGSAGSTLFATVSGAETLVH